MASKTRSEVAIDTGKHFQNFMANGIKTCFLMQKIILKSMYTKSL